MANERDREMESAMGPDEEPGEAKPAPADQAAGLGGLGTEGKAGNPEGGDEPQLPDVTVRDDANIEEIIEGMPDLRKTVESPARGTVGLDTDQTLPPTPPDTTAPEDDPARFAVSATPLPEPESPAPTPPPGTVERSTTEMTPEGSKPDLRRNPGERIRGGGG